MWKLNKKTAIILGLILLFAGFLRLYLLDSIPPGLYPDEAMNANDALTSPGKVFYPENFGREGLYVNLVALSFKILGPSSFSLRLVSSIIGILTVLGLYLLVKELFQKLKPESQRSQTLAFLASFFLSISFWHINFSRIGFRGILLPFVLVFCFYFFFRGLRKKNVLSIVVSGLFFGLGFYTYSSFRLAFLILPFAALPYWLIYREQKQQKKFFFYALSFITSAVVTIIPLGLYFLKHPSDFLGRLGPISVFAQSNPIKAFFISLIRHLGMFNFSGDFNWRHNLSGSPELLWPIGILFLLGLLLSTKRISSSLKKKNYYPITLYGFLLGWFFVMLLPGALTYEGVPHSLRTIGVIPVAYIFAAIGGIWLFEKIKRNKWSSLGPENKYLKYFLYFVIIFFLFTLFTAQFQKYFYKWAGNSNVSGAFTQKFTDIGKVLNSLSPKVQKYVIVNEAGTPVPYPRGVPVSAQTVMFLERMEYGKLRAIYLRPEQINQIKKSDYKTIILPMRFDDQISNKLKAAFPNGHIKTINNVKIYEVD